jgi:hypothetical protein
MASYIRESSPFLWDTSSPASLYLVSSEDGNPALLQQLAYPGAGCNKHELSALYAIIRAHEDFYEDDQRGSFKSFQQLSLQCRSAVQNCVKGWDDEQQQGGPDALSSDDCNSLEFLKAIYTVMHLSDVFLPLLPSHNDINFQQDPFDKPGVATADMVRYLRCQHMLEVEKIYPSIQEMSASAQPEQYGDGELFWACIRTLTLRGCLEEAWDVLSTHSMFVRSNKHFNSYSDDPYLVSTLDETREGFMILQELMLRAPLPGGRNDYYDDCLDTPDWHDDDIEQTEYFLEGLTVERSDYKFWEGATSGQTNFSMVYNSDAAMQKHRSWQVYVSECRGSFKLSRRIPELDSIMAILCGQLKQLSFDSWAEQMCAELLFVRPDIRPRNMSASASRIMKEMERRGIDNGPMEELLSIMNGNAGRAIEIMYIYGGASGAALPTTLLSILYNSYIEVNILPSESAFRKTEFICEAASAIISSLQDNNSDAGARLATRLLSPVALDAGCPETVASIASIFEHLLVTTDAEARELLSLCRPFVERKSLLGLDAYVAIILSRYRHYIENDCLREAMQWLIVGIESEASLLPVVHQGSCYRKLTSVCLETARLLLTILVGDSPANSKVAVSAREAVDLLDSDLIAIPEAKGLKCVVLLFDAMLSNDLVLTAEHIVACLRDEKVDTGDLSCALPYSLHWSVLQVAKKVLELQEKSTSCLAEFARRSAFDKTGVAILMQCLARLCALSSRQSPGDETIQLRQLLATALAQAFISENAMLKESGGVPMWKTESIKRIRSVELKKHSASVQEQVVQSMLDV